MLVLKKMNVLISNIIQSDDSLDSKRFVAQFS
jgi:hypothetical protein